MRRLVTLVLVTAAAVAAAAVALAARSPEAELSAMRSAMGSKHSVHYVAMNSEPGFSVRMVCDVAGRQGIQRVTVTRNGHTGPAQVIVYRKVVFIKGTAFTMRIFFGFTEKQARRWKGQWIFITHSSQAFAPFAAGATFGSFVASLFPADQLSLVTAAHLIGVRGTAQTDGVTMDETVFAPDHGRPLPTKQKVTFPGHPGTDRATLSHWNEAVHVPVPAHAVPIEVVNSTF